jgi:hypothetical protein
MAEDDAGGRDVDPFGCRRGGDGGDGTRRGREGGLSETGWGKGVRGLEKHVEEGLGVHGLVLVSHLERKRRGLSTSVRESVEGIL